MSRKKKAMRAFLFQNPDATRVECWDAAWANEQSRVSSLKHQELEAQVAEMEQRILDTMRVYTTRYDEVPEFKNKTATDMYNALEATK